MEHSDITAEQSRMLHWLWNRKMLGDPEIARIVGLTKSAVTKWRNGQASAPFGLLGGILSNMPVMDAATFLQFLADRYAARDGLRIVVSVEEDHGDPDPEGLRDGATDLAVESGQTLRMVREGDHSGAANHARALVRTAQRVAYFAEHLVAQKPLRRVAG